MFQEQAATQLAAYLIKKSDGRCNYLTLLKMMYDADRTMLLECGRPITFDKWVSMGCGPVLSSTYDLLKPQAPQSYWSDHIQTEDCDVILESDPGDSALSDADIEVADKAFEDFRGLNYRQAIDRSHELFVEWADPGNSQRSIDYEDVLRVYGRDDEEHLSEIRIYCELNELLSR